MSTNNDEVIIPETPCPFFDTADFEELKSSIQPLSHSTEYGIDLYEEAIQFVCEKLNLQEVT